MTLKRSLGFWDVFCLASGAMISSGLFVLPGLAFAKAGPAVVLSYALAGVMVVPAMLAQAELATAMPRSGGTYFFIERSMGALPGTLAGLANWLSVALKSAFALVGIGAFSQLLWPNATIFTVKAIGIGFCVVFTTLNIVSVSHVGKLQVIMVVLLLGTLGVFLIEATPWVTPHNFAGFFDKGPGAVIATAGMVFVSFGGLTKVASVAEEVKNPGRNLPRGMFSASIVVSILYVAVVAVVVGVTDPADNLASDLKPVTTVARRLLGPGGAVLVSAAAMLAFITTANGGILAASRSPMAMSRDGLAPNALQYISPRFGTPMVSILLTSGFMVVVIASLSIEHLVKAASAMMLMLFAMVNVAVLIMRRSQLQNYRPLFRAPGYPWLQVGGAVMYLSLIASMGRVPLLVTGAFAVAGVAWRLLYVRRRSARESALVYLVKRLVSRQLQRGELEDELRSIALERDQVVHDRFDDLVSNCEILDLQGSWRAEDLFERIGQALAPRIDLPAEQLTELFRQREQQTSTVVQPGLAIPHVIVPGANLFEILLVRIRDGALFPSQETPVRIIFALVGSEDQRNYHLQALMAIAHVVQEHGFVKRWLAAPQTEHLRDVVLLSRRKRQKQED